MVCQVPQVFLDPPDLKVSMDVMDPLVFLVFLDLRVTEEENVLFAPLELRERKAALDSLACLVLKVIVVFLVFLVPLETQEMMDFLDLLDPLAPPVPLETTDSLVFLDRRENLQD